MRFLFFVYIVISALFVSAQSHVVDSLLTALPNANDTVKVEILIKLSSLNWNKNNSQSLIYAKKALELSTEINFKKGIAGSLSSLGVVSMYDNNSENAIINMKKAIDIYKELNDSTSLVRTTINLGAVYYNHEDYEKSIEIYKSILNTSDKYLNNWGRSILFNNIALNHIAINENKQALIMLNRSLAIKEKMDDNQGIATCYSNMGIAYTGIDSIETAKKYYLKAKKIHREVKNNLGLVHCNMDLANLYIKEKDPQKAKPLIEDAIRLINENNYLFLLSESYSILSKTYEAEGNFEKALDVYQKSIHYKDSVLNKESYEEAHLVQVNYEVEEQIRKEKEIEIEKSRQLFIRNLIIAILIFVIILSIVIYNRYKLKIKSEHKLQVLNSEKDKFFSIISHDLRGPFTAFLSLSEVIANSFEDLTRTELYSYAKKINDSAIRINYLLENLLEWSVSQTKIREYIFTKVDLKKTVNRSIELLNYNADKKQITITNNVSDGIFVNGDINSIKTIFRNIMNNAIKFTNVDGKITINAEDIGEFYKISISDTGIGISKENLKKLFRIDVQFTTPGTDKEKGTGLGLILVKEFVEKNGGKITVESEENKGTTFYFTLKKYENE